jgi:hypothetical protein
MRYRDKKDFYSDLIKVQDKQWSKDLVSGKGLFRYDLAMNYLLMVFILFRSVEDKAYLVSFIAWLPFPVYNYLRDKIKDTNRAELRNINRTEKFGYIFILSYLFASFSCFFCSFIFLEEPNSELLLPIAVALTPISIIYSSFLIKTDASLLLLVVAYSPEQLHLVL